jgi:hypothetical protein
MKSSKSPPFGVFTQLLTIILVDKNFELDPDSVGPIDPNLEYGSGSKTILSRKKFNVSGLEELNFLSGAWKSFWRSNKYIQI